MEYIPLLTALTPCVVSATDSLRRMRRAGEASPVDVMSVLTAQVLAGGMGGTVTYLDAEGCRWTVTVGSTPGIADS